jgi:hypothetical protein
VSSATDTAPSRKQLDTTGLGPYRSATREPISAPMTAPPLSTSRNDREPLALNPARSISSGSQVFSE